MSEFKFALNLLRTTTGNACVSPLNIAHALGMVMLGLLQIQISESKLENPRLWTGNPWRSSQSCWFWCCSGCPWQVVWSHSKPKDQRHCISCSSTFCPTRFSTKGQTENLKKSNFFLGSISIGRREKIWFCRGKGRLLRCWKVRHHHQ